jgi:hypothetical protein
VVASDVIVFSDIQEQGLGDHFCITSALKNYSIKHNKKIILFSRYPKLFEKQSYIDKSLDYSSLSKFDYGLLNLKYEKILHLHSNKDCKSLTNIVEQYCECLNVKKEHYPYFEITTDKYFIEKNTIIVSITSWTDCKSFLNQEIFFQGLVDNFKEFNFIDSENLKDIPYEYLPEICHKSIGHVSINTSYLHMFNNSLSKKKGIHLYNIDSLKKKFAYKDTFNYRFDKTIYVDNFIKSFEHVFRN